MFGFLNSAVLLAGLAALIPLVIHLFSRRRVKIVEFSSLRHLKEMEKRQLRRLKIRQWLLLILRMLIVLVAVLAFARPTAREGGVGSHAAVSAVVLFDNSASMTRTVADGDLLDIARRRTTQLLSTFSQADEIALLALDPQSTGGPSGLASASAAQVRLDGILPGAGSAQLESSLESAVELLSSADNLNREIYLISDRQRVSLPESEPLSESALPLYLVDLPLEPIDNLGLVAIDLGGQLIRPGHDFDLVATVRNYGRRNRDDRIASLFLDGRRVAQVDVAVTAGGETGVRFTQTVSNVGFHSGYVELTDDAFEANNRYYFSFRIPDRSNLLIIDADPVASLLELALVPDETLAAYWSVKQASPESLSGVDFLDYDVVVLAGVPELSDSQTRRLQSFVARGGSLAVIYGARTDVDRFNRTWSELTGVRYESAAPHNFTRAGYYTLDQIETGHPIFQPFDLTESGPPAVKFWALPRHTVDASAEVLMTFTGGHAALVEKKFERGTVMTFAGPMSPDYSDITSHGFFVPFASRLVEYLAADLTSLETRLYAGQPVTRALTQAPGRGRQLDLIRPDSSVIRVAPEEDNGSLVIRAATPQAGVYHLMAGGREIDRWAINVDPAECDLAAVDPEQLTVSVGADEVRLLTFDQPLAATIADYRVGRELWQVFLWIAVVLLAVEALLGRRSAVE